VGCLAQHLAVRKLILNLTYKPSAFAIGAYISMTALHYFYRNGMSHELDLVNNGAGFLGFPDYHFYSHGFLTILSMYTSHIIPFLLLPLYLTPDIKQIESLNKSASLVLLLVAMLFTQCLHTIWATMIGCSQRNTGLLHLIYAPACFFSWCHIPVFFILSLILMYSEEKEKKE
jgi:hypothetical protein